MFVPVLEESLLQPLRFRRAPQFSLAIRCPRLPHPCVENLESLLPRRQPTRQKLAKRQDSTTPLTPTTLSDTKRVRSVVNTARPQTTSVQTSVHGPSHLSKLASSPTWTNTGYPSFLSASDSLRDPLGLRILPSSLRDTRRVDPRRHHLGKSSCHASLQPPSACPPPRQRINNFSNNVPHLDTTLSSH